MPFHFATKQIPDGLAGTHATVQEVIRLIQSGSIDPLVRKCAVVAIEACPNKDKQCEAAAIFSWIKGTIRFVNDPWSVEMLHTAEAVIQHRSGDCDDMTILSGAMLRSIGIPVRIVIIGANPENPKAFSHIYLQAWIRNVGWVGFDPSVPGSVFGWEPEQYTRRQIILVPDIA